MQVKQTHTIELQASLKVIGIHHFGTFWKQTYKAKMPDLTYEPTDAM